MNRSLVLVSFLAVAIIAVGCGKKTRESPFSMEANEILNEAELISEVQPQDTQNLTKAPASASLTAPVSSSEKPSPMDIQQALKNAGFYQGKVDGIIGPKSKQAVKDFQAQNNLTADGKVGPKTWASLRPFLSVNPASAASSAPAVKE